MKTSKSAALLLVLAGLLPLTVTMGGPPLFAAEKCQALIDARCEVCHYKTRICQALGKKNKSAWQGTIKRMVGHGARLTAEERQQLVDCLAQAPQGADFVCKHK